MIEAFLGTIIALILSHFCKPISIKLHQQWINKHYYYSKIFYRTPDRKLNWRRQSRKDSEKDWKEGGILRLIETLRHHKLNHRKNEKEEENIPEFHYFSDYQNYFKFLGSMFNNEPQIKKRPHKTPL